MIPLPSGKYEFWYLMTTGVLPCPPLFLGTAGDGYSYVSDGGSVDEHDLRHAVIELSHESSRAGMKIETALADGHIDDPEDREIRRSFQTARNHLARAEAKVEEFRRRGRG